MQTAVLISSLNCYSGYITLSSFWLFKLLRLCNLWLCNFVSKILLLFVHIIVFCFIQLLRCYSSQISIFVSLKYKDLTTPCQSEHWRENIYDNQTVYWNEFQGVARLNSNQNCKKTKLYYIIENKKNYIINLNNSCIKEFAFLCLFQVYRFHYV